MLLHTIFFKVCVSKVKPQGKSFIRVNRAQSSQSLRMPPVTDRQAKIGAFLKTQTEEKLLFDHRLVLNRYLTPQVYKAVQGSSAFLH